jgi:2-polyprenyl-3-methyl-5-hydroxy-6-metoxy-1,4-benzoquinol methylase
VAFKEGLIILDTAEVNSKQPWQLRMFRRSLKKQLKLKALLPFTQPTAHSACLLITCGDNNGALNWYFRAQGGQWTWTDLQEENISQMEELLSEKVYLAGDHHLPFEDAAFDLVVAIDVLEHLRDDQPFLTETSRILKPGGSAVVTVPNGDPRLLANKIKHAVGMRPEIYGHTRAGYSLAELSEAVQSSGFHIVNKSGYSRFFTEMIELVINFGFVFMLSKKRGQRAEGQIAPTKASELKTHGAAYQMYSLVFPVLNLFSKLDVLLPASTNNAVIVVGQKEGKLK